MMHNRVATLLLLLFTVFATSARAQSPPPPVPGPCTSSTPCPTTGVYYYCTQGREFNGCQDFARGPFPSFACQSQCVTSGGGDGSAPAPPPPPNCSGQIVVNASAPLMVYCEKRLLPGKFVTYHDAFQKVATILSGKGQRPNSSTFYPAMPGVTTFISVQDSEEPDHLRELQFFSSIDVWLTHSSGPSGAAILPAGAAQAWYGCAFMGLVNISVRKVMQQYIDFSLDEHGQPVSHIPLYWGDTVYNEHNHTTSTDRGWEVPGEMKPRLDLISGFSRNPYMDPQRPPGSPPLPPCPGPALTLTEEQQAAPIVLTVNITAVKHAAAAYITAFAAMADYMATSFPCVQVFRNVNDPAMSTDVESKYFTVLHYSSYACLDAALLEPPTSTGKHIVQAWFDTIQHMDMSVFGQVTDQQQKTIVTTLKHWQPAFRSYFDKLKVNFLMKPGLSVAGFMANTQVNYNGNDPFPGWANIPP